MELGRAYLNLMLLLGVVAKDVAGARILALMLVPAPSHHRWNSKYLEALVERGHHVTHVGFQAFESEKGKGKVRNIVFELESNDENWIEYSGMGPIATVLLFDTLDHAASRQIKNSPRFKDFADLVKREKFDLVVHDVAMCAFVLGAVHILGNPPVVGVTPFYRPSWIMDVLGNPIAYASHPHSFLSFDDDMTFVERLQNYLFFWFHRATRYLYLIEQNKHAKDAFGDRVKPIEDIHDRINVVMVNANEGIDFPYPRVPGLIPVGGLHIEPAKKLPKELQSYLDDATSGAMLFSLGTLVAPSRLDKEKIGMLMSAFEEIRPIKVLMKWDDDVVPDMPDNVKVFKWLPQNDVLAHPRIRLFFSHSGLLSTQEAIFNGVPVLGLPFSLDQHMNIARSVHAGFAEKLDYQSLTKEEIVSKIKTIVKNSNYSDNARRLARRFRDTPERPIDRAVYWTEYVLRHDGAEHLRLAAKNLSWYQNNLIDIYLFILVILVVVLFVALNILRFLASRFRPDEVKTKTS